MNLYPRKPSREAVEQQDQDAMDRARAHQVLDEVRSGGLVPPASVDWALRITGDLTGQRADD